MGKGVEVDWSKPTIDQAINAGMALAHHYGSPFSKIDIDEPVVPQPMTDKEAEDKLLGLAEGIIAGTVNSHVTVAKVIRSLGSKMGVMGSVSTEIDLAAFKVYHAIREKQGSFVES